MSRASRASPEALRARGFRRSAPVRNVSGAPRPVPRNRYVVPKLGFFSGTVSSSLECEIYRQFARVASPAGALLSAREPATFDDAPTHNTSGDEACFGGL